MLQLYESDITGAIKRFKLNYGTAHLMKYNVREIEEKDNTAIEHVIRTCLIEYGANHEGTAWADPHLGTLSIAYNSTGNRYWVAETEDGQIVAGAGIGELEGNPKTCELQKMYCLKEHRGSGVAHMIMDAALSYARQHYSKCYLETFGNMIPAQKFYRKHGFELTDKRLGATGHFACDVLFIRDL